MSEKTLAVTAPKSEELRERSKDLFFSYNTIQQISRQTGVSPKTLSKWRDEDGWEGARKQADLQLLEDTFSSKRVALARITRVATDQIERGLKVFTDRFEPPTLRETEMLTNIVANLDKIARLDSGKATENVSVQIGGSVEMTVDKIRDIIKADPFLTVPPPPDGDKQ